MLRITTLLSVTLLITLAVFLNRQMHFANFGSNAAMEKESESGRMFPSEWMDMQRTFPYGTIKTDVYLQAIRGASAMHRNASSSRSDYTWEFTGPTNIGGRITDIEIPQGSFSTIYIAAASGGIFKSVDNGLNWTNVFKSQPTIAIGDLAIDPSNTDIIWAGTGESNASSQSYRGDGIYKSVDGGLTWQHMGLDLAAYFGRIVVDHSNSNRVFAAVCGNLFTPDANRGIYRTTDGGNSWQKVLFVSDSTSGIDIVQHPGNPDILYAAMWERMRGLNYRRSFGPSSGIWMSEDGGDTWMQLTSGLPQGANIGRIGLAISPSNPSVLYAFYDNASEVAVYKTSNGGQNWTRTNDGQIQGMNSSFGWYFGQIRVDPVIPDIVYVMGVDLYTSTNGGNSWNQLAGYFNSDEIHVDHHAMYIHPVTGRVYEGNDGGLYYSDDAGNNWNKINNLPITQFYDIETDVLNPVRIYGGTQDNNTVRTSTGQTAGWGAILGGDGFYSVVDYTNSNIVYAEYQYGALHKSTNGGASMNPINGYWSADRVNWSAPVVIHPQEHSTLYFGTYRVWKTTNAGSSWSPVSGDLTFGNDGSSFHTITTLAVSPVEPLIVLAGTDDGRVHISTNGGSLWNEISAGLPERWITRVAADPFDVNTIYVTLSGFRWDEPLAHIYRSVDLGVTWEPISDGLPDLPVNAFVADPGMQGRYFAGTDAGVFMSEDSGSNWVLISASIGNVPVTALKINSNANFLLAGTYGLSSYKFDLNQLNVGVAQRPEMAQAVSLTAIFPNPVLALDISQVNVQAVSPVVCDAQFRLVNAGGKIVLQSAKAVTMQQGSSNFMLDEILSGTNNIEPGIYFLQAISGSRISTRKIVIL